jgi:hypothetical protein
MAASPAALPRRDSVRPSVPWRRRTRGRAGRRCAQSRSCRDRPPRRLGCINSPRVPTPATGQTFMAASSAGLGAKQPTGLFCTLPGKTARWVGRRAVRRGPRKLRRPVVGMMVLASRSRAKGPRLVRSSPPVGPGTRERRNRRVQRAPHLVQEHGRHGPEGRVRCALPGHATVDAASFSSGTANCTRPSGGRRRSRCPTVP